MRDACLDVTVWFDSWPLFFAFDGLCCLIFEGKRRVGRMVGLREY